MARKGSTLSADQPDHPEVRMQKPEDVSEILHLRQKGFGSRRIAEELGISRNTVKRYLRQGGWAPSRRPKRRRALEGLDEWLRASFRQHRGNADVVRQELRKQKGIDVSLRTVERHVTRYRQELEVEAKATVRFETPPGKQLQIDFGQMSQVVVDGKPIRVHLFVATLGHSRRPFVAPFRTESQENWFEGLDRCFRHFNGVPEEVLIDNPKALVTNHDPHTGEVTLNEKFKAFAAYWGFRPVACRPYRPRTKGKTERGVGYVKRNCMAGHVFADWEALEAHVVAWMRDVADVRVHDTTGERPIDRFERDEKHRLRPLRGRPPFQQMREVLRKVHADGTVEVDTNHYSVPWRLAGDLVSCRLVGNELVIAHLQDSQEIARHTIRAGRREYVIDPSHLEGIAHLSRPGPSRSSCGRDRPCDPSPLPDAMNLVTGELERPLSEYQAAIDAGTTLSCGGAS